MTASRALKDGRRVEIDTELADNYKVNYTFQRQVDTNDFDIDKSLHNQARFEALDEPTVEVYKEAVLRGDKFPAVIAYRPGRAANAKLVIIDGNHRLVAHHRAGKPIDVYEIERGTKGQVIALMTYGFNTKHGRGTSPLERITQALYLLDNGASIAQAAEALHVKEADVRKAQAKANADRRADEVGIDRREWDVLQQTTRNRLLNISTDEGFQAAAHLTYAARLNSDEVFELVALLNTTKSATRQRNMIKSETERYQERIEATAGGILPTGVSRKAMTPRGRVGMLLGQLMALPDDVTLIARGWAENERSDAAKRIIDASERLRKIALALDAKVK